MTLGTRDHGCTRLLVPASLAMVLAACGDPDRARAEAARCAFADFQAALQSGDRDRCRRLLTAESAPVLDEIPWARVRAQQPLQIVGARPEPGEVRVRIRDPNEGDRESDFVVVRENGRHVVDLVATAGLHTTIVGTAPAAADLEPRKLTPADFDRIRQQQLAEPLR
jgi:hypothetical protein